MAADRYVLIDGGALVNFQEHTGIEALATHEPIPVMLVPLGLGIIDTDDPPSGPGIVDRSFRTPRNAGVKMRMSIGTIDELVAVFRTGLEHAAASIRGDSHPVDSAGRVAALALFAETQRVLDAAGIEDRIKADGYSVVDEQRLVVPVRPPY